MKPATIRKKRKSKPRYNGVGPLLAIFMSIGALALMGAAYSAYDTLARYENDTVADGEVIDIVCTRGSGVGQSTTCTPVVQFVDAHGQVRSFHSNVSSRPVGYDRGDHVTVLYNSNNARIDAFSSMWGMSLFLVIFGAGFLGFPSFIMVDMWLSHRRLARRKANAAK